MATSPPERNSLKPAIIYNDLAPPPPRQLIISIQIQFIHSKMHNAKQRQLLK